MKNPFMWYVENFEEEAENFLRKYNCEDAIENPRPIPIQEIATKLMSLEIISTECLSPLDSVQGAIAFSEGIVDVYDWSTKEYMGYNVSGPCIFVDSGITNTGRFRNTLAHECYHWWRHRNYFNFNRNHENSTGFGIRCDTNIRQNVNKDQWTDMEKMEWQARTIAPKILMPRKAFKKKIDELYNASDGAVKLKEMISINRLISELADFFEVSEQSVAIRMTELGYEEAYDYANTDQLEDNRRKPTQHRNSKASKHQQAVSIKTAFEIYCENEFLRTVIDTGVFCYAGGYFVINDDKYIEKNDDGFCLTSYAQAHLYECTLDFAVKLVGEPYLMHDASAHLMYRSDTIFKQKTTFDSNTQNADVYNKAKEFEKKFMLLEATHKTATELLWGYMQALNWNTTKFMHRTKLDAMHYSRVQKPKHKFKMDALVAMGVGLELDVEQMEEVLSLAGMSFDEKNPDREIQAYRFLFTALKGKSIDECNAFLQEVGIPQLGSKQRL